MEMAGATPLTGDSETKLKILVVVRKMMLFHLLHVRGQRSMMQPWQVQKGISTTGS